MLIEISRMDCPKTLQSVTIAVLSAIITTGSHLDEEDPSQWPTEADSLVPRNLFEEHLPVMRSSGSSGSTELL